MAILLAARVAEIISGLDILTLVDCVVFQPLEMKHSAQGLGRFALADMVSVQTERAAPESGGGDPTAKDWDWNSPYRRKLAHPGEARMLPRQTSRDSWPSSWTNRARWSNLRPPN